MKRGNKKKFDYFKTVFNLLGSQFYLKINIIFIIRVLSALDSKMMKYLHFYEFYWNEGDISLVCKNK